MKRHGATQRAALIFTLGLAVFVGACQPAGTSGTAVPTSSPSATVTPSANPSSVPSLASGWERQTIQAALDAPLTSVVWTGTQFLTVDSIEGTIFVSPTGRVWQQEPRFTSGHVGQVAAGPNGLLAVGSVNVEGVVAIWHSADGIAWTAAPDDASLHGRDGAFVTMVPIAGDGEGWLAVGGERLNCVPGACGLVRAVAWTSPDGLAWTRSADSAAMQHAVMTGIVRSASGYIAVGGSPADPSRAESVIRPAVWTSSDGRIWTRSDQLPTVAAAEDSDVILDSVAVTGSRIVAIGHVETHANAWSDAFAWWNEGGTWSSVEIGRFILSQQVRLVAVPGGLLAMFGTGTGTTCSSSIWRSQAGSSWGCIGNDPVFADSAVSDAAVSPGAEVLVGSGVDGAVVWVSVPP